MGTQKRGEPFQTTLSVDRGYYRHLIVELLVNGTKLIIRSKKLAATHGIAPALVSSGAKSGLQRLDAQGLAGWHRSRP
jgi:hypothetical protein